MIKIQSIINRLSKQIIDHLRLAGTWCNHIVPSRSFLEYQRNTTYCKEIENRQLRTVHRFIQRHDNHKLRATTRQNLPSGL